MFEWKGYSPERENITHAELLIRKAEEIDPNYCDVHWQYAQLLFKQFQESSRRGVFQIEKQIEFEERLTKSVLCGFSMSGAYPFFQQYWKLILQGGGNTEAQQRYMKHVGIIEEAAKKDSHSDEMKSNGKKQNDVYGNKEEL